jgi:hypothetical protein
MFIKKKKKKKERRWRLGLVAQAYNPSYLGGRDERIMVQAQPRQKVLKTLSQATAGGGGEGVHACHPSYAEV